MSRVTAVLAIGLFFIAAESQSVAAGDQVQLAAGFEGKSVRSGSQNARDLIYCQGKMLSVAACAKAKEFWSPSFELDRNIGAGRQVSRPKPQR